MSLDPIGVMSLITAYTTALSPRSTTALRADTPMQVILVDNGAASLLVHALVPVRGRRTSMTRSAIASKLKNGVNMPF
jgi:hypothetical protein